MPLNDEARERFTKIETGLDKTLAKQDETLKILNGHMIESGVRDATFREQMKTAFNRIDRHEDEHKEKRGWWAVLWGGVVLMAIERVVHFFSGNQKGGNP